MVGVMTGFAACPAECGAKVVIWPGDKVNFCCAPCWDWHLKHDIWGEPVGGDARSHSDQCDGRQEGRRFVEVTAGNFSIMVVPARESRLQVVPEV